MNKVSGVLMAAYLFSENVVWGVSFQSAFRQVWLLSVRSIGVRVSTYASMELGT